MLSLLHVSWICHFLPGSSIFVEAGLERMDSDLKDAPRSNFFLSFFFFLLLLLSNNLRGEREISKSGGCVIKWFVSHDWEMDDP